MGLTLKQAYLWKRKNSYFGADSNNLQNLVFFDKKKLIDEVFFPPLKEEFIESSPNHSWQRQFFNIDFLKSERKRINDVQKWWLEFYSKPIGSELSEVIYYTLPTSFDSETKASIAKQKGDVFLIQLSALKNTEQMGVLMILPMDKKCPTDYSLIRIINAKKDFFTNLRTGEEAYIINVEEYEIMDPASIYLDIPFERKIIHKFLIDNLIKTDDIKARALQSPISSSPFIKNVGGGITYSSYSPKYSFSEEFLKTLKMINPPEFTDISKIYPLSILNGKAIKDGGISFKLGESTPIGKNYFSCFASSRYKDLVLELINRERFFGEYSVSCSLNSTSETASERLREILSKFVQTEISNRMDIEDLKYSQDIDLFKVQNEINEDLWIQIANQRQIAPIFEENFNESFLRKQLLEDWKGTMESFGVKNPNINEISLYANKTLQNIKRVAQSIARDKSIKKVDDFSLDESYRLFSENTRELISDSKIQKDIEGVKEEGKNKIIEMIQVSLTIKSLTLNELFEEVRHLVKDDILILQEIVDKLSEKGFIYSPRNGCYKWV
jgi:hypothetical protein